MEEQLHEACEAQIVNAARESQQAVADPDDFPLGPPACDLGGECESCQ